MSPPVLVVVGHVNRGKSSIVSTLAADDSVRIDALPGTTRHCREFPLRAGGQTLYTLVDTPGFERPRQVLNWLRRHETSTAKRRKTVEQFVRESQAAGSFRQECELLSPILAGGAILYVVDGSKPPTAKYEAEMEILRWTAQPRVALINATTDDDYSQAWHAMLDQYFNMVRPFNAHQADFAQRLRLLEMLREMSESMREPLDHAIDCLKEDRRASFREAARVIAEMLLELIATVEEKRLSVEDDPARHEQALAEKYYDRLRKIERAGHRRLKQIFLHHRLDVLTEPLRAVDDDLFARDTWNRFGLNPRQLTAAGLAAGAMAGGMVDAASAAVSFPFGTLIGGAAGGAATWYAAQKLPEVKIQGFPLGGRLLRIGPMKNPGFPWLVLDRALLYLELVATRAHARRDEMALDGPATEGGRVASLDSGRRRQIERLLAAARRQPGSEAFDRLRSDLADQMEDVIHAVGASETPRSPRAGV